MAHLSGRPPTPSLARSVTAAAWRRSPVPPRKRLLFPEEWRRTGRENSRAALADFRNSIVTYPSANDLASVEVPVVCTYGARSPDNMARLVQSLASAIPTARTHRIEGAGHAVAFDALSVFVQLIADAVTQPKRAR